jgi:predicted aspartyl protease
VEASLANGKKIRLLIDTGSAGLFVVERAVAKGGLSRLSEETVFAGGASGRTESSRGLLAKLSIGDLEFTDALITTTKDEFDPHGRYHGVLGLNVFDGYRVTLDFKKKVLTLEPCAGEAEGVPYWDVNGQMLVRARAGERTDGMFLLDTGAVRSMVGRSMVDSLPGALVDQPAVVRTYGGNVASAATVRGVTLRCLGLASDGGPVFTSDLTLRSRLGGVEVSGFIGMDLLDRTRIVVDTRAHRVGVVADAAKN